MERTPPLILKKDKGRSPARDTHSGTPLHPGTPAAARSTGARMSTAGIQKQLGQRGEHEKLENSLGRWERSSCCTPFWGFSPWSSCQFTVLLRSVIPRPALTSSTASSRSRQKAAFQGTPTEGRCPRQAAQ